MKQYGIDGIMIGRAAIGYPWIFNEIKHYFKTGAFG
jgi:tRNA-dihydrouridine synthase